MLLNEDFLIDNMFKNTDGSERAISVDDLDDILIKFSEFQASDIYIHPSERLLIDRFGEKIEITKRIISAKTVESIAKKIFGNDVIARIATSYCDDKYEILKNKSRYIFRCNATSTVYENNDYIQITIRRIDTIPPTLEKVGLNKENILYSNFFKKSGLALVCGGTGTGKSSLLASIISTKIQEPKSNLVINEYSKPVEFVYDEVEKHTSRVYQTSLNHDQFFSNAIINSYRRKPDIIVIGEMRDKDSITAALQGARTGHYLIGTVHVDRVASAFRRITLTYPQNERSAILFDLISQTQVIIAQMLLPRIGGGRVAIREYLFLDSAKRKKLESLSEEDVSSAIREMVIEGKTSFLDAAKKLYIDKQISKESLKLIAEEFN